jgi:sodium/potassium-transporting ATPase subunit alpha
VDNSSLTGESEPVQLQANLMDRNLIESRNVAFFSTHVVEGSARGVVFQTGDTTVMGGIAHLVTNISPGQTPIKKVTLTVKVLLYGAHGETFCQVDNI